MTLGQHLLIVSDAGPLIALAKTHCLHILKKLFAKIIIPPAIATELHLFSFKKGSELLRVAIYDDCWIEISEPLTPPQVLLNILGKGEAEAIFLAKKLKAILLIDEKRGRMIAQREGVKMTGTGAVLIAAKKSKIIKKVSTILNKFQDNGYHISPLLYKKILQLAGE